MIVTFRARRQLEVARHVAIARAARELAAARPWRCGAPLVTFGPKLHGELEIDREGDNDLGALVAWLRTIDDTSWELDLPDGTAVIGPAVPAFASHVLDAWCRGGPPGALDPDRYGPLDAPFPWTSRGLAMQLARIAQLHAEIALAPVDPLPSLARLGRAGQWSWQAPPSTTPRMLADRAASELGLQILGRAWIAIPRGRARALLASAIERDLAYRYRREDVDPARGQALIDALDDAGECFTNGTWDDDFGGASTPIGDATFDVAFALVDTVRVAMVWIGDED